MIPREMYCDRCGGFVKTEMHESWATLPPVRHEHLEDCVERLASRIERLWEHPALSVPPLEDY